ncbi:MAG: hypothetical protein KME20_15100 [Kaiparowitsia implicata GSE-PSE-MK54-09C]|jgi:DNA-binding CsgD family transcriptional regulator|nr:hypothetical protein [Kaiparowitsia implicata GSE-PSE-MK54-09C]
MNEFKIMDAIVECYPDGIMLVSDRGVILKENKLAQKLRAAIAPDHTAQPQVPEQIWSICQLLISDRPESSSLNIILEDRINLSDTNAIRIRVRWFESVVSGACLMVTLEDEMQSARNRVMSEKQRYGLTPREAEVWLLRQVNYTYKRIAETLHITVDTVKKHIKSINAKRQAFLWSQESYTA